MPGDEARLLIAEHALEAVKKQYATLAEGQDILSGVLIGRPQKDGTVTTGLVSKVEAVREKQDENGEKIDDLKAEMGDIKTTQADQGHVLAAHTKSLTSIEAAAKSAALWIVRGIGGALGLGALHLLTLWWPAIVNFFTTLSTSAAADAAVRHAAHHAH